MKSFKFYLTLITLLLFWGAANAQNARVQVIHNAADAAASTVDVWLIPPSPLPAVKLIDDFMFRTASAFIDAPAGSPITIGVAGGNSTAITDTIVGFTVTLTANETYVVVANGIVSGSGYSPAPAFNLDIMAMGREAATMTANTDVLVYHGATDAPTVDVVEVGAGAGTVVDDISYTEFQGYLELATADYVLEVRDMAGTATVASYQAPLSTLGLGGAAITVLASGFLDPSMNSNGPAFGLYAATATGGPLVMLPVTPKTARVQVIHNSADAAATSVDVYLNGTMLIDDFAFRTASAFIDAPAGVQIEVAVAGGNSASVADSIKRFFYTLTEGETYILIANGIVSATGYSPAPAFNLDVMAMGREAATMSANTDVLVYHGSTDAPTVDVAEVGVGAGTIVDDISYTEFDGYLELATADYVLEVQTSSGAKVAAFDAPLSTLNLDGAAITVLASGFLDPTMNSNGAGFGLYAATAAGGPLVMLPGSTNSIENLRNTLGLNAYPNPSTGVVNLQLSTELSDEINIEVFDATGRVVFARENSRVNSNGAINPIDLSDLNEGMYIIQVRSENRTGTYKIHLVQ